MHQVDRTGRLSALRRSRHRARVREEPEPVIGEDARSVSVRDEHDVDRVCANEGSGSDPCRLRIRRRPGPLRVATARTGACVAQDIRRKPIHPPVAPRQDHLAPFRDLDAFRLLHDHKRKEQPHKSRRDQGLSRRREVAESIVGDDVTRVRPNVGVGGRDDRSEEQQ